MKRRRWCIWRKSCKKPSKEELKKNSEEGEEYLRNWKSAKQQISNKHVLEKQEEQHK